MKKNNVLTSKQLSPSCDFGKFKFKTTGDLENMDGIIGQEHALSAIKLFLRIHKPGYNLFVSGPIGLGRHGVVEKILHKEANQRVTPPDWCYVNNFIDKLNPKAISLLAGQAVIFRKDMDNFIESMQSFILSSMNQEQLIFKSKNIISALKIKYKNNNDVVAYLNAVENNIFLDIKSGKDICFICYQVNVFVNNNELNCAPVIYEDNPTVDNLVGRFEYSSHLGTVESVFTSIKSGSLHRANGGYLILDIDRIILNSSSWDALKRALRTGYIKIEYFDQARIVVNAPLLKPEIIPLDIKIILIGSRAIYYLLMEEDIDFPKLFKVLAEFDDHLCRSVENNILYARLIATLARHEKLRPLNRSAVERVMQQSSRILDDSKKLSVQIGKISDLLCESNYWASESKRNFIDAIDVRKAIEERLEQLNRLPEHIAEDFMRKYTLIDVSGSKVGQINGLTVSNSGDFSFGHPVRITAVARIGRSGEIISIEREVDLSGSIHSKGVMILTGFLRSRYARQRPLSLSASLVFEQTYENIDGDSASVAELCALLSVLSRTPIKQSIGITGSINQHGEVQAIASVNEKIEGFFDLCKISGLTGDQGVIIPESNIQNVILREEVFEAVKNKKFHIYYASHIDEAISILMGVRAGKRGKNGKYPWGSINYRVEKCLDGYSQEIVDEKNGF